MNENELLILLADDDSDDCILFKEALDDLPLSVKLTTVHNGEQLLLLRNAIGLQHDILLFDLNMPRKNGVDCLSEIRKNKNLDGLALIPVSKNEFSELKSRIQKGIKLAKKYLIKTV